MADSKRLNITVPESTYEDWFRAVEDEAVAQSVSELIRTSVNRELEGHHNPTRSTQQGAHAVQSEDVQRALNSIQSSLEDVEERMRRIEEQSRVSSESETVNLQKVVLRLLPEVAVPPKENLVRERAEDLLTAGAVANQIDGNPEEVLNALIAVSENHPQVATHTTSDGTAYFWREP
ncbi:hypothetical protein [Halobacteriaceae bacterium SHR40]|uniref:hypothetical protein n=1 Tax=Halovenus amylolytica TaxID=2500550 RepID=UPI000FE43143